MAKKNKEVCPYCGKSFVYLSRHKCKLKSKEEKVVEIKQVKLGESKDTKKIDEPIQKPLKPIEIPPEEDVIVETHSETVRFISKFIETDTIKLERSKDKNILKNVLKSPIESFKFLDKKEVNFIRVIYMVNTIGDLIQYKDKNLYDFLSARQLKNLEEQELDYLQFEKKIKKAISIGNILNQLREKSIIISREQQKVIVAGLDKAGKTAILTTFGGKLGLDDLSALKPTKRVDRQKIETKDLSLFIWDFGGQTKYRHEYLNNPGSYFLSVNLLLYVIDVQDYARFDESFSYLKEILGALKMLEENPYMLIFIHKYDPDLRNDPDINLNVEFIKENLKEILVGKGFEYEIYLTSIYSIISNEPKFSKYLKKMVSEKVGDPTMVKIEELGAIIDNALNAIIKLSESVSRKFNEIEDRFIRLENAYIQETQVPTHDQEIGVTIENIKAHKAEILAGLQSSSKTSLPPLAVQPPPPPPPPPPPVAASSPKSEVEEPEAKGNVRGAIIDELKELFARVRKQDY